MKIINTIQQNLFFSCLILSLCATPFLQCKNKARKAVAEIASDEEVADITFNYHNEDISAIINELAATKGLNVIFPPGDILNVKVTLHIEEKMTISQAWDLLNTLLDVAGFFIVPQGSLIRVIKNGKDVMSREPLPTYIGVDPTDLPNNDQPIRYLYYFANMKVSDQPENEINGILKDLLPEGTVHKADPVTNGLLIVARSNDIRAAMRIILELDRVDFQEKIDIISLHHTSASTVAQLINKELVLSENANPYRLDTKKAKEVPYFSGFTKVIALDQQTHLNKLLILGRPQAIQRLKDFIVKYIDVAPDSGESMLHVYHLQYLDADRLAPVLNSVVQGSGDSGGPNQASAGGPKGGGGVERFFDKVIIYTDSPSNRGGDNANTAIKKQKFTYYGGNNLVVAARNDDWKQIKKLIEQLDVPQKQVLIEVLVADLTAADARLLGSQTRIPDKVPFPDDMAFQSAQFSQVIPSELNTAGGTPASATVNSNLLKNAFNDDGQLSNPSSGATKNLADFAGSGTTMLSLNDNDGRTWSIWELLQSFTSSKVLSHPHIITRTNQEAIVTIGQTRWLKDQVKDIAGNYYGGAVTIKFKPIAANLVVKITPRISSANTVNLQVLVDIDEWQLSDQNIKNIRTVETNAYVKNGGIFVLGGLIRTNVADTISETPLLGKIPILGWFFKRKAKTVTKNNLTVFISPTIIEPRLRKGVNEYTQDYIDLAKDYAREDLFDSLKDPITRWFFQGDANSAMELDAFAARDANLAAYRNLSEKELKKASNREFDTIDSTDRITRKAEITIAANTKQLPVTNEYLPDLKNIVKDDPNPFLQT